MAIKAVQFAENFDLNVAEQSVVFNVMAYTTCAVQTRLRAGTYGTNVLTLTQSMFETGPFVAIGAGVTISAAPGKTADIDCSTFAYLRVQTTTPEGAAGTADIALCGVNEN